MQGKVIITWIIDQIIDQRRARGVVFACQRAIISASSMRMSGQTHPSFSSNQNHNNLVSCRVMSVFKGAFFGTISE